MSDFIAKLQEKRANIWEQGKALLDAAEKEGRELTAEEADSFRKMNEDMDALGSQVTMLAERAKADEDMRAAFETIASRKEERPDGREGDDVASEFRKLASGESRGFNMSAAELRDLTKGTASSGGATVPTGFYGQLWAHLIETAQLMNYVTVITTDGGNPIVFPTTTANSSAALIAENTTITESDPAFTSRTLSSYKYAVAFQAPTELLDDTGVDLEGYLAMQAGRAVGNTLGAHLMTGTGSSQPAGLITGASLGVTGGTGVAGVPTADNLIDLYYSVIAPYRASSKAAWVMKDSTVAAVRKLKDTTNQYIWTPGLSGAPDSILGKPLITDPNVASTAVSAKSVAFGDLSAYYVRVAGGMRFERSTDFAFGSDQITFRCILRADGVLLDQTGAVKYYAGGAS
ncbi:MAG TPA: phage major capsid protein [Piscinibacter sp.]|nr:phage major capsid protein [Piscinibacter sp.]